MGTNKNILASESHALAPQRVQYYDIAIESGKGALLRDANGKEYIDLLASASSTNTGHAHPHVVDAISKQASKLIQYTPAYFANVPAAKLADRLCKLAPISGQIGRASCRERV